MNVIIFYIAYELDMKIWTTPLIAISGWFIFGFITGIILKNHKKGLYSGLISGVLFFFLMIIIFTLMYLIGGSSGGLINNDRTVQMFLKLLVIDLQTFKPFLGSFLMIITNTIINLLITSISATIGGLILPEKLEETSENSFERLSDDNLS